MWTAVYGALCGRMPDKSLEDPDRLAANPRRGLHHVRTSRPGPIRVRLALHGMPVRGVLFAELTPNLLRVFATRDRAPFVVLPRPGRILGQKTY